MVVSGKLIDSVKSLRCRRTQDRSRLWNIGGWVIRGCRSRWRGWARTTLACGSIMSSRPRWSMRRSRLESTSSTPPTSTAAGAPRNTWGARLGGRREDVLIATKFAMPVGEGPFTRGGSRHYIERAVAASLRRLGTDYIDVYQMHQPDAQTPIEETLEALTDLVRRGVVRYIGQLELQRLADRRRRLDSAQQGLGAVCLGPERVEPAAARGRSGGDAGLPRVRARPAALFPARQRLSDRQVPPRRTAARRYAPSRLAAGDAGADQCADGRRQLRHPGGARALRGRARPQRGSRSRSPGWPATRRSHR